MNAHPKASATLYRIKPKFQATLRPLVDRAAQAGVRPNHLTVVAIGVSVAAGADGVWLGDGQ